MSKRKENFNVTQGMTLLLLKKLSLSANFVFQLILFITDPENNIGMKINRHKKTAQFCLDGFFVRSGVSVSLFPLRRISTPHIRNLLEAIRALKVYQMSFSTVTCANT